jgi:hypothetical protein
VPGPETETLATIQGKPVGVRNGRVTYFAAEWPHFAGLPEHWVAQPTAADMAPGCVLFAYRRGAEQLLAGVARQARPVTGTIEAFGFRLQLENCTSFVASRSGDRVSVLCAEGGATARPRQSP